MMLIHVAAPDGLVANSYAQDSEEDNSDEEAENESQDDAAEITTLPVTPLNFSIIRKGRVRGTISIVPVLIIKNPTEEEILELNDLMPLLRSDLMSIASLLAKKRFRINRPIDPDMVANHFQHRIDQRIGSGRIKIYIQDAIIRPIR